jgi:hypothetical protein
VTRQPIDQAIFAFDQAHAQDPNLLKIDGRAEPSELVKARRLTDWVLRLEPNPSDALRLAARCQHLERWKVPRASYPEGRLGYLKWRKDLAKLHAEAAGQILETCGVEASTRASVRAINLKQDLKGNPDAQTIEDALCLCFLEHELEAFSSKHEASKLLDIIRKTWRKMSARARVLALSLSYRSDLSALITEAVGQAEQSIGDVGD